MECLHSTYIWGQQRFVGSVTKCFAKLLCMAISMNHLLCYLKRSKDTTFYTKQYKRKILHDNLYSFPEKIFNVRQPQSSAIFTTSVWIFTQWQYFSSIAFYALLFAFMKTICNNNNLLDTLISFIRHLVYSYYEFYGSQFLPLCRIYSNSIN